MYDVARIDERFGLRPDQMIDYKALKGDPTDNIPGVPGVGEKTAAKLIREFGDLDSLLRAARRGHARTSCATSCASTSTQIRMGRELSTIVRDLPIDFDLERGAPRRLRPRHRRPAVPRVRVPDAHRAPAADGRRDRRAADRAAADGRPERLRARGARRRPAGRLGPEPDDGPQRPAGSGGLQLRLDFDAVSAVATPAGAGGTSGEPSEDGRFEPAPDLPTALAAAIVDPGRIEVRGADGVADLEAWLAAQPAVGVALLLDDPRPRRGTPAGARRRRPGRSRGRRGRARRPPTRCAGSSNGWPRRSSATRSSRSSSQGSRTIRTQRTSRSPSTPRSPPTSSTRRCAARRSRTSSPRRSTRSCRRRPSCRPRPGPGSRRCRRSRSVSRSSDGSTRSTSSGCSARSSCRSSRSSPGWRPSASRSIARRSACSNGSSPPRSRGSRQRSTRRRPRVQPGQPEAARAGPVLRARPAQGPQDQDRLLDRCLGARGPAPGPPDDRQAARVAGLHEAPLDLRRGAPDADRRRRPAAHDLPPGRGVDRTAVVVRPEPPEHPDPDRARAPDPAGVRGRATRRSSCSPPTTPRSSCGSSPTCRATSTSRTPSRAAPTSTARPPRASSTRIRRTSPTASARWPRWSTSGWPTG